MVQQVSPSRGGLESHELPRRRAESLQPRYAHLQPNDVMKKTEDNKILRR